MTGGLGADVAMEAVGIPETFELCTRLVRPGGHVANIGVHGKPATLHLETLWIRNITDHHRTGRHQHDPDAAAAAGRRPSSTSPPSSPTGSDGRLPRGLRGLRRPRHTAAHSRSWSPPRELVLGATLCSGFHEDPPNGAPIVRVGNSVWLLRR